MRKWAEVMDLLSDGEWCSCRQLQHRVGFSGFQAKLLANFLVEYGFCNYRMKGSVMEVRLRAHVLRFLENLDRLEPDSIRAVAKEVPDA